MRWDQFRRSDNVEDTRGQGGFPGGAGGASGLGIGTIVVLGLIGWALGIDPRVLIQGAQDLNGTPRSQYETQRPVTPGTPSDRVGQFVAAIVGDTEDRWSEIFAQGGRTYSPPKLRLFSGAVELACGFARAASGPFYCPKDRHVYLDTSFFDELEKRFRGCQGKACEFAEAYVIAHEVGHHVQNSARGFAESDGNTAKQRQGFGQSRAGHGRAAGRLLCRRLGQSLASEMEIHRAGRRGSCAADRGRHRRRPSATAEPWLHRPRQLHPWLVGAAGPLVLQWTEVRRGVELQHVRGGAAVKAGRNLGIGS